MRLEAKDRKNPQFIAVAHISDIRPSQVKVSFDGWTEPFSYWCHPTCTDLHPIGYCDHIHVQLCAPGQGFKIFTNSLSWQRNSIVCFLVVRGNFDWNDYLNENDLNPAPLSAFTSVRTNLNLIKNMLRFAFHKIGFFHRSKA